MENSGLEVRLYPKPLFSGGSDGSCLKREPWKMMTVMVEWQRPLLAENVSRIESLIKNLNMTYSERQEIMKVSPESLTRFLHH